jgi:hypothetical protein
MKLKTLLLALIIISFYSCTKNEGLGGQASIEGKVYVLDYNQELTTKLGEYYAPDIDVYIIYGEDSVYDDDFTTSYDGSYRFEFLQPGYYKVFAYSEDTLGISQAKLFPVFQYVNIDKDDNRILVDDIVIVR